MHLLRLHCRIHHYHSRRGIHNDMFSERSRNTIPRRIDIYQNVSVKTLLRGKLLTRYDYIQYSLILHAGTLDIASISWSASVGTTRHPHPPHKLQSAYLRLESYDEYLDSDMC